MKRKSLFFLIAFVVHFVGLTQNDTTKKVKRVEVYFAAGNAIPIGQFASYRQRENNEVVTGYAYAGPPKRGMAYGLGGAYAFGKCLGAVMSFVSTCNETPALQIADIYQSKGGGLGGGSNVSSMTYWAGSWRTNNFMAGLFASTHGVLKIKVKLLVGLQVVNCPEVKISGAGYNWTMAGPTFTYYTYNTIQFESRATALVTGGGIEVQQNIFKGIFVKASAAILLSRADFNLKFSERYSDGTANSYTEIIYSNSVTKNISFLSFSVGIGYCF